MKRVNCFVISFTIFLAALSLNGYCLEKSGEPVYAYGQALSIIKQAKKSKSAEKYEKAALALQDIKKEFYDWDCIVMVDHQIDMCTKEIESSKARETEKILTNELGNRKERRIVREAPAAIAQEGTWVDLAKKEAKKRQQQARRMAAREVEKKAKPFKMTGKVSLRYENDWGNDVDDQKVSEYILLKMDDIVSEHVSAYLHMRSEQDLAGADGSGEDDTRDRIYSAYLDLEKLPLDLSLRGGRQYFPEAEAVHFDGLRLNWSDSYKRNLSLFGGRPVTYYGERYADLLTGGVISLVPSRSLRLAGHYVNIKKDNSNDNGVGVSFYKRFGRAVNLIGRSSFLNEELKDLSLMFRYNHFPSRVSINSTYYRQMLEIDTSSGEYSPYILSLGSYIPFHHISLNLNKSFGDSLQARIGTLIRRPLDSTDEAQENMKFNKYFGSLSYSNLFWKGFNPSVTLSHWDNPSSNRNSLSGILTQELGDKLELSLGTFFSNYYYSFYTNEERTDTRTYFFKLDYDIIKNWDVSFDLSRQDSSNYAESTYSSELRVNRRF